MLIVTTETIPGRKVKAIGLVRILGKGIINQYKSTITSLENEAANMEADAIVGFRYSVDASSNLIAYGTAVKYDDQLPDPEDL